MTTRPSLHPEGPEDQADGRAGADAPLVTQVVSQGEQLLSSRTGRIVARWLLVIVALVGVGWLFWRARQAMTPFMFGLVLAYLLTPLVNRLARYMRRPLAILIVYMIGIALLVLAFMYLIPPVFDQIQRLISNIPTVDELQELSAWFLERYRAIIPESLREPIDAGVIGALRSLQDNISAYVQQAGGWLATSLLRVVNTVTFLLGFLIVPIWLFYVINDQQQGMAFLNRIIHPRARSDFWNVVRVVDKVFTGYIRGQLILGVAVGLMAGAGLLLLQLFGFQTRYILLLAIIAGVTELIPIIGPILGAIPAVAIAFFSPEDPLRNGLAVLVLYIVIQQLENNLLVPRIVGESVGVHPAILTVVLIAMGEIFGLLVVILSAPLAAVARDLFVYVYQRLGGVPPSAALQSVFVERASVDMTAVDQPEEPAPPAPVGEADAARREVQREP